MPKGNAGRLIARDLRNNADKRRRKIKTKANVHKNQQEILRISGRVKKQKTINTFDFNAMMNSDFSADEFEDEDCEAKEPSITFSTYKELLKSPKFVLSFQPRYTDYADQEDEE